MADYQDIRGLRVKYLSADPSTTTAGEVWYNSTSGTLKASVQLAAAWSAANSMGQKQAGAAAAGTQTAALIGGGNDGDSAPPGPYSTIKTEEYNGASWTAGGNMNTSRFNLAGSGSQTAALGFMGNLYPGDSTATEEYNGASWATSPGSLGTGGNAGTGFGTQTATICVGGVPGRTTLTEAYDGSTWTAGNAINTPKGEQPGGIGVETAGLCFGGSPSPPLNNLTEEFNGTSWTAVNNMLNLHSGCYGFGTQIDAIGGGGGSPNTNVEAYDGTDWSTAASVTTGRSFGNGLGTPSSASAGLVTAGEPTRQAAEEYTGAYVGTQTLTTS